MCPIDVGYPRELFRRRGNTFDWNVAVFWRSRCQKCPSFSIPFDVNPALPFGCRNEHGAHGDEGRRHKVRRRCRRGPRYRCMSLKAAVKDSAMFVPPRSGDTAETDRHVFCRLRQIGRRVGFRSWNPRAQLASIILEAVEAGGVGRRWRTNRPRLGRLDSSQPPS